MEPKVGRKTSGPLSRWSENGGVSPRRGSGDASGRRTFEDDLALLDDQILTELLDRGRPVSPTPSLQLRAFAAD